MATPAARAIGMETPASAARPPRRGVAIAALLDPETFAERTSKGSAACGAEREDGSEHEDDLLGRVAELEINLADVGDRVDEGHEEVGAGLSAITSAVAANHENVGARLTALDENVYAVADGLFKDLAKVQTNIAVGQFNDIKHLLAGLAGDVGQFNDIKRLLAGLAGDVAELRAEVQGLAAAAARTLE